MVLAINECVLPIISYSFGIINWLEGELKQFDTDIRKMLHLYKMIQIKNDVDRLYSMRQKGGRGMLSVWDSYKSSVIRIAHVIKETDDEVLNLCGKLDQEKLFSIVAKSKKFEGEIEIDYPKNFNEKPILHQAKAKAALAKKSNLEGRLKTWQAKPQHGAFLRQLNDINADMKASCN